MDRQTLFGDGMKLSLAARQIIGVCGLLVSLSVLGQGLPPGVTLEMVEAEIVVLAAAGLGEAVRY